MKILAGIVISSVVLFALFTWWALESGGVAIIETRTADGSARSTHVWYAEPNGELWVEAGTPENGWFVDIGLNRRVTFATEGASESYVAETIPGKVAHQRIRNLLREKYGVRDWWIGVIFDTTRSIAVRLVPAEPGTS